MSTILIADDNPAIRLLCRRELEEEGYEVLTARDGLEAVTITDQFIPDVVVLDVIMSRLDGLEALSRITRKHPDVGVILFTAFDDVCVRDERAMAATACVAKGRNLAELKRVIANVLRACRDHTTYRIGLPPRELVAR